jgi:hypothetical protein
MFRLSLTRPLVLLGFPLGDVGPGNMTLCRHRHVDAIPGGGGRVRVTIIARLIIVLLLRSPESRSILK